MEITSILGLIASAVITITAFSNDSNEDQNQKEIKANHQETQEATNDSQLNSLILEHPKDVDQLSFVKPTKMYQE